ncbi:hypothetical protein NFI96_000949 [Prochilodus magdalenae]|nr:hypothetical protein NFI96_000949 [Prochilodus magdalenae]
MSAESKDIPVHSTAADVIPVQTCVKLKAQTRSSVIAPVLTSSTFNAPVHLNIYTDTSVKRILETVLMKHKTRLKKKFKFICEGDSKTEHKTLLNNIYTGLFITERQARGEERHEHEIRQVERKSSEKSQRHTPINCNDIFKEIPYCPPRTELKEQAEEEAADVEDLRTVLTKGIAGIGKTVSVQKFILDWAEEKANKDVHLMIVMPFRELNVVEADQFSLCELICIFNPELKDLPTEMYEECKIVFILDGLDEFYCLLNFHQKLVSNVAEVSSVDKLMINLIKGTLLPSAQIWITSRPAAADHIPSHYINRVTEVQGFSDLQKEEYFRKKIRDQDKAKKIISHIKTARSLHIMCHIPVFCWITATLLQQILNEDASAKIPQTLTEMYTHFLFIQTKRKNQKYDEQEVNDAQKLMKSNREMLLKLAELAFKQLIKGKVIFSEEDLRKCGIDVTEASVYSGICTEIFKEESVLYQRKVYCFVHLSFQEFLAALYVFHCYLSQNTEALQFFMYDGSNDMDNPEGVPQDHDNMSLNKHETITLDELLTKAVDKALRSQNGHLDLFLRFLLGISLESNHRLLQGLLTVTENNSKSIRKTVRYIQSQIRGDSVNHERKKMTRMKVDSSINLYLCLTEMNDQSFHSEIQEYLKSEDRSMYLSPAQCSAVAYMLQMSDEVLEELDLKKYNTSEEGYRRLIPAITNCRKALLAVCKLTHQSCKVLASALLSPNSLLKNLDLTNNDLHDSGVELLFDGLKSLHNKLEILRLSGCLVTEQGCSFLALALRSNLSYLKELDLTYNHPGDSGLDLLSDRLKDPHCSLETLKEAMGSTMAFPHGAQFGTQAEHSQNFSEVRLDGCGEWTTKPGLTKYSCELTLDPNTAHRRLSLCEENRKVVCVGEEQAYPDHPERFDCSIELVCSLAISYIHSHRNFGLASRFLLLDSRKGFSSVVWRSCPPPNQLGAVS